MGERFSQKGLSMSRRLSLGLVQVRITADVTATKKRVFELLEKIRRKKPSAVVLPEMWLGGPKSRRDRRRWARLYRNATAGLSHWCAENRIGAFFSAVEEEGGRFFNTAFFVGP